MSITPTQLDLSSDVRSGVFTFSVAASAPLGSVPVRVAASSAAIAEKKAAVLEIDVVGTPGELDPAFGDEGVAVLPIDPFAFGRGIAARPEGDVLLVGNDTEGYGRRATLVQIDPHGRPDEHFEHADHPARNRSKSEILEEGAKPGVQADSVSAFEEGPADVPPHEPPPSDEEDSITVVRVRIRHIVFIQQVRASRRGRETLPPWFRDGPGRGSQRQPVLQGIFSVATAHSMSFIRLNVA